MLARENTEILATLGTILWCIATKSKSHDIADRLMTPQIDAPAVFVGILKQPDAVNHQMLCALTGLHFLLNYPAYTRATLVLRPELGLMDTLLDILETHVDIVANTNIIDVLISIMPVVCRYTMMADDNCFSDQQVLRIVNGMIKFHFLPNKSCVLLYYSMHAIMSIVHVTKYIIVLGTDVFTRKMLPNFALYIIENHGSGTVFELSVQVLYALIELVETPIFRNLLKSRPQLHQKMKSVLVEFVVNNPAAEMKEKEKAEAVIAFLDDREIIPLLDEPKLENSV